MKTTTFKRLIWVFLLFHFAIRGQGWELRRRRTNLQGWERRKLKEFRNPSKEILNLDRVSSTGRGFQVWASNLVLFLCFLLVFPWVLVTHIFSMIFAWVWVCFFCHYCCIALKVFLLKLATRAKIHVGHLINGNWYFSWIPLIERCRIDLKSSDSDKYSWRNEFICVTGHFVKEPTPK